MEAEKKRKNLLRNVLIILILAFLLTAAFTLTSDITNLSNTLGEALGIAPDWMHRTLHTLVVLAVGAVAIILIVRLITEIKQAEKTLLGQNRYIDTILEKSPIGFAVNTIDDGIPRFVSARFEEIYGIPHGSVDSVESFFKQAYRDPVFREQIQARVAADIAGGDPAKMHWEDIPITTASGEKKFITATNIPIPERNLMISTVQDVTQRVRAEEQLRLSEEKHRTLHENMAQGVIYQNADGEVLSTNPAAERILEATREKIANTDIINKNPRFIHEDGTPYPAEEHPTMVSLKTGKPVKGAIMGLYAPAEEEYRWIIINAVPLFKPGEDKPHQVFVTFDDITERKQAEETIKHAAEEWRNTFDSITDMISIIDKDHKLVRINRHFADVLKSTPQALIGQHCYLVTHRIEQPLPSCPHTLAMKSMKTETVEYFEPTIGIYIEESASPLLNTIGEFIGTIHVMKDITGRKQAEKEKNRLQNKAAVASRLAAVGELAAGIAHEINNPLTGVLGFSQLLLEKKNLPSDISDELKIIAEGSQRVADIVRKLLTFARQTKPTKTSTDINGLIDNTLKLRSYVLKTANIEVVTQLAPNLPWLVVDPGQLQQVFLNLIVNAEQAMKHSHSRGKLTITSQQLGNSILLTFQDDGPGISMENMEHLFEPFFTTKQPGEGTGLGLSLSRSIILEHGGELRVESEPGKGAAFIIELPLPGELPASVAEVQLTPAAEKKLQRKARILVVDDEESIRKLLSTVLTQAGHTVETTASPQEALDKIGHCDYDAIFIDIRMPDMSGIELRKKILEKTPAMAKKFVFITGDTSDSDVRKYMKQNNLLCISKPFDIKALEHVISAILNDEKSQET